MEKRAKFLFWLTLGGVGGVGLIFFLRSYFAGRLETAGPDKNLPVEEKEEVAFSQEEPLCTRYANEEYGFSFCYPVEWSLPGEIEVNPPQQHLQRTILNPDGESYLIDIYDQPSPVALGSFIRDYFNQSEFSVVWTADGEINGQEILQFFLSESGGGKVGRMGVAFGKKGLILTISGPLKEFSNGGAEKLAGEKILKSLAESFEWKNEKSD